MYSIIRWILICLVKILICILKIWKRKRMKIIWIVFLIKININRHKILLKLNSLCKFRNLCMLKIYNLDFLAVIYNNIWNKTLILVLISLKISKNMLQTQMYSINLKSLLLKCFLKKIKISLRWLLLCVIRNPHLFLKLRLPNSNNRYLNKIQVRVNRKIFWINIVAIKPMTHLKMKKFYLRKGIFYVLIS